MTIIIAARVPGRSTSTLYIIFSISLSENIACPPPTVVKLSSDSVFLNGSKHSSMTFFIV